MENNKSAMYTQAGRSRGWNQGVPNGAAPAVPEPVASLAIPVTPAIPVPPEAYAAPVVHTPPVVVIPEQEEFTSGCQAVGIAFVAMQKFKELYEPEQGFSRGTVFAELDLPFVGEGACKHD